MAETVVDIRLLLKHTILQNATTVAMEHHHPNGNKNQRAKTGCSPNGSMLF